MKSQLLILFVCSLLVLVSCKDQGFFSQPADGALNGLTDRGKEPEFSFDWINKQQITKGENIITDGDIQIVGWAMDPDAKETPGKVFVTLNGVLFTTETGIARDDVAAYFNNPAYQKSGFRAKFARASLQPGVYSVGLRVVGKDGKSYYASSAGREVVIKL